MITKKHARPGPLAPTGSAGNVTLRVRDREGKYRWFLSRALGLGIKNMQPDRAFHVNYATSRMGGFVTPSDVLSDLLRI